jgi:hypothetical protein
MRKPKWAGGAAEKSKPCSGGRGGRKYLVLIPYGTMATRFLFHTIFLKSHPPSFFISFSSLELISSMTRHHATKRRLLHGTTAVRLDDGVAVQGTTMTWLLKAPWRRLLILVAMAIL